MDSEDELRRKLAARTPPAPAKKPPRYAQLIFVAGLFMLAFALAFQVFNLRSRFPGGIMVQLRQEFRDLTQSPPPEGQQERSSRPSRSQRLRLHLRNRRQPAASDGREDVNIVVTEETTRSSLQPQDPFRAEAVQGNRRIPLVSLDRAITVSVTQPPELEDHPAQSNPAPIPQGSVVLHAIVGKDGQLQGVQVVSGPPALASAAIEAVKQLHYTPYYRNGDPVETGARITVNFTVSSE